MNRTSYVCTLDFGYVPIRRTHTAGDEMALITLSDNGTKEYFASIRKDYTTNQPFAVLLDEDMHEL